MIAAMSGKVVKRASTPPSELGHRWFLPEWAVHLGKIQADAQRELGWPRAKTSDLWNGKQRYTQESMDEAARWLGLEPFELLMLPAEALAIRHLRSAARSIVDHEPLSMAAEHGRAFVQAPGIVRPESGKR